MYLRIYPVCKVRNYEKFKLIQLITFKNYLVSNKRLFTAKNKFQIIIRESRNSASAKSNYQVLTIEHQVCSCLGKLQKNNVYNNT